MHVLLVLNGTPPGEALLQKYCTQADLRIAVDGGYKAFRDAQVKPDVLLGDLDSVEPKVQQTQDLEIIQTPDQTLTDLQKAIDHVFTEYDPQRLTILGGTGQRNDHFLNNLIILAGIKPTVLVELHSAQEHFYRITEVCPFKQLVKPASLLSIIALGGATSVTTSGLKWDLTDSVLGTDKLVSQSNLTSTGSVEISISSGTAYVIVNQ